MISRAATANACAVCQPSGAGWFAMSKRSVTGVVPKFLDSASIKKVRSACPGSKPISEIPLAFDISTSENTAGMISGAAARAILSRSLSPLMIVVANCTTKTFQLVALWLAIFAFTRPGLRGLNRCCINDVYTPFCQNDVLGFKLTVDLSQ